MAKLVVEYNTIGFTILPYSLNSELQDELDKFPGRNIIGYVTYNKETSGYKFKNASTDSNDHWSIDIIKKIPYNGDTWIVLNCPPHKLKVAFQCILYGETIDIEQWDTWSVETIDANVAVITSYKGSI